MTCPTCNGTRKYWNGLLQEERPCIDCSAPDMFFHATPNPDACQHDFKGWREFEDGLGGETVCTKCGMGAMAYSLRIGP